MQDKLNREDFVLERFPDDLLHELERKEFKEELEKAKKEAYRKIEKAKKDGFREGREEGREEGIKEGREENYKEIINKLKNKGMSEEEIHNLLDDKTNKN